MVPIRIEGTRHTLQAPVDTRKTHFLRKVLTLGAGIEPRWHSSVMRLVTLTARGHEAPPNSAANNVQVALKMHPHKQEITINRQ